MKKTILSCLLLLSSVGAMAQMPGRFGRMSAEDRAQMLQQRTDRLVKDLGLTGDTVQWFGELYAEYQKALVAIRTDRSEETTNKRMRELSDQDAQRLIENIFSDQEKALVVKRSYYLRFCEKLSGRQLLKIFIERPARQQSGQRGPGGPMRPGGPMGRPRW